MKNQRIIAIGGGVVAVAALLTCAFFTVGDFTRTVRGSLGTELADEGETTSEKAATNAKVVTQIASRPSDYKMAAVTADRVVEEYVDEVTVTTANVVATIDVQLMNNAPHFCTVEVRAIDGLGQVLQRKNVTAPPFSWSGWWLIIEHTGAYSVRLKNIVKCNAGVIRSRVRYFK